jgi:Domain of unknown function DUF29
MNKPAKITVPCSSPAYDADGYGWAMAQGRFLRERRFDAIDWDNVAEEIETMGRSERRVVESALRVTLMHHLKWAHQELYRSRSWAVSISTHLATFDEELANNPSLRSSLDEILQNAYHRARIEAAQETGLPLKLFPEDPPSWDDIRAPRDL